MSSMLPVTASSYQESTLTFPSGESTGLTIMGFLNHINNNGQLAIETSQDETSRELLSAAKDLSEVKRTQSPIIEQNQKEQEEEFKRKESLIKIQKKIQKLMEAAKSLSSECASSNRVIVPTLGPGPIFLWNSP